ncbi:hypothetical protein OUZ56_031737 [Daphnia magna]|uniref:Uncharacterized protein n=1 Tax=Daphnia magna TaxID=35525 RepID=A0ABQ9ZV22_9CRUS|nr:hypothetical protein OUZ56_031737 [Daphnia magna]
MHSIDQRFINLMMYNAGNMARVLELTLCNVGFRDQYKHCESPSLGLLVNNKPQRQSLMAPKQQKELE